jgi:energy-coupling factor transporter ATP-binding protein EcfA2
VQGARQNNLKDVSIEIPKRRLTVFTGVSGSGKSSLGVQHHRGGVAAADQRPSPTPTQCCACCGAAPASRTSALPRPFSVPTRKTSGAMTVDNHRCL